MQQGRAPKQTQRPCVWDGGELQGAGADKRYKEMEAGLDHSEVIVK